MAKQEVLEVANNTVVNNDDEFADGCGNGYLYYYDRAHQLACPLTVSLCMRFYARI